VSRIKQTRSEPATALPPRPNPLTIPGAELHRTWLLRRALAASDWFSLIASLTAVAYLTEGMSVSMFFWAAVISPLWLLMVKLHGLYDHDHRRIRHSTFDELPRLISAAAIGTLLLAGLLALGPTGAPTASSMVMLGGLLLAGSSVSRAGVRHWWRRRTAPAVGVVIGPADAAAMIARRLKTHPESRLNVIGYLAPAGESAGAELPEAHAGDVELECLGTVIDLHDVAQGAGVERVVIADGGITALETEWLIGECKATGLSLTLIPHNFTLFGPTIQLNRLAELPVLDFRFSPPSRSTMLLKRTMDVAVSAGLLALASPFLLAAAAAIKFDTKGPALLRQRRTGKNGVPFTIFKLRTMVADAEERLADLVDLDGLDEPAFKLPNDPRITRVGRVLRRTSLDELPQLINVLRGEMSLVGPRPEEESVVALYNERQRVRLSVKPGMTGPMQVSGRGDLTFEERLALDRDYLDSISITGDLALLLRTPGAILRGDGAY